MSKKQFKKIIFYYIATMACAGVSIAILVAAKSYDFKSFIVAFLGGILCGCLLDTIEEW